MAKLRLNVRRRYLGDDGHIYVTVKVRKTHKGEDFLAIREGTNYKQVFDRFGEPEHRTKVTLIEELIR